MFHTASLTYDEVKFYFANEPEPIEGIVAYQETNKSLTLTMTLPFEEPQKLFKKWVIDTLNKTIIVAKGYEGEFKTYHFIEELDNFTISSGAGTPVILTLIYKTHVVMKEEE